MRDRYFDLLRAAAIVRVVLNHSFMSLPVVSLLFPSMGLMFALGGSLMTASVDRGAARAVRNRLRRLLPSVWAMGLILVPLMLHNGWEPGPSLALWILPLAEPPRNEIGDQLGVGVLWYVYTYIWMVLLSPILIRLYRRWDLPAVLAPFVGLLLLFGYPEVVQPNMDAFWWLANLCTYGTCWMIGIAHREGGLARLRPALVLSLAGACAVVALTWAWAHPWEGRFDLVAQRIAYPLYMIGFVLVLLRWSPPMGWLARVRPLDRLVSVINNRAVTIYLWHVAAIAVAARLCAPLGPPTDPVRGGAWPGISLSNWPALVTGLAVVVALLAVAVLALGWVEDLAARRRPRLSPFPYATSVGVPAVIRTNSA
ncbi:acyltransferase [Actinoplanes sp. NPDC051861]|uniref:acyltransferase family protein n=1 Tax=Actinoplanes sp. NPDC051861 TaxID=3155170 RepID=UPI0034287AA6